MLCPGLFAQGVNDDVPSPAGEEVESPAELDAGSAAASERTSLNLLGEVDSESGEARRNENVRLTLIDNNVLKELNTRMGTTATIAEEFDVQKGYFGKEFGGNPSPSLHVPTVRAARIKGELFWSHNNSAFTARSFFQVGDVQPARTNDYGFKVATPFGKKTRLSVEGSQRRLRGQVNGNVLAPAADERTPTTTDPARLAIVNAILGAYPDELPNRTDINPRALNTNAPQNIDNDRASILFERELSSDDRLALRYSATLQDVEAFQLVGGQNPDTTTKSHQARITWTRTWSPAAVTDFSMGFDRVGSLLVPEETSLGPFYLFGRVMQSIGPSGAFPLDRAQNLFRYAGRLQHTSGNHTWTYGFDLVRRQINGSEANDHRGLFSFRNDFGRDQAGNLLAGTPSLFRIAIGSPHRGFRNWDVKLFVGDQWRATSRLSLSYGLRYEPVTAPTEVNGLSEVPYDCDCNNWAPRFGFAYKASERWAVLRANYGIQYGEIFPATYMASRFNTPGVLLIALQAPDLANPLAALSPGDLDPDARSTLFRLDPELSTPYSHQYNFSWQMRPIGEWTVDLAYVGSRSPKLLQLWYMNRARPVEGVPLNTRTVNQRRPDQRYFDILQVLNGSRGYYDAAKVSVRVPRWAGLTVNASYWFSKALDLGSSYTNTAFGRDGRNGRSPTEFDVHGLMKGPSDFDQSHALLANVHYETPAVGARGSLLSRILGRWQISSVMLIKTGTPFTVRTADAPGLGNVDGAGSDRPNLLDRSILGATVDHPDTASQRLPLAAFGAVERGAETGNLGRNTFRKDGVFNVNSAVSRRFALGGDAALLFRAEALNVTNHPQFAEPGFDISGANFGQITNTLNDGRTFKLTLRLAF